MLELRGLHKRLGRFALNALDLQLEAGEYFVLLGPSGVGKSVLLELIAGLQRPDAGQICWEGRDLTELPPEARPFAIVYQDLALFPHMNVRQNIGYGPRIMGLAKAQVAARVGQLAELLRITALLERRVTRLSGGEAQRVALARALATRPALLLLDEPLSALDAGIRGYLRNELAQLHRGSGTAFLHVTHDQQEARQLADRVGVMLDGELLQVAPAETHFRQPSSQRVAAFLGLRNLLPIDAIESGEVSVGGLRLRAPAVQGDHLHLWIPPEELIITPAGEAGGGGDGDGGGGGDGDANQIEARILDWYDTDSLRLVRLAAGAQELSLEALVSYRRFCELGLAKGQAVSLILDPTVIRGLHD